MDSMVRKIKTNKKKTDQKLLQRRSFMLVSGYQVLSTGLVVHQRTETLVESVGCHEPFLCQPVLMGRLRDHRAEQSPRRAACSLASEDVCSLERQTKEALGF